MRYDTSVRVEPRGASTFQTSDGTGDQVAGHLGEGEAPGYVEGDLAVDPKHRTPVDGQHLGLDGLLGAVGEPPVDLHGAAHVLLEQGLRAQEVVPVVLLEKPELLRVQRPDMDGLGLDLRRDVGELDRHDPSRQCDGAHFPHQSEVLVVDGDRDVFAVCGVGSDDGSDRVGGRRGGRERKQPQGRDDRTDGAKREERRHEECPCRGWMKDGCRPSYSM